LYQEEKSGCDPSGLAAGPAGSGELYPEPAGAYPEPAPCPQPPCGGVGGCDGCGVVGAVCAADAAADAAAAAAAAALADAGAPRGGPVFGAGGSGGLITVG
jgi:hypothetical protein